MNAALDQFRDVIRAAGLEPPDSIEPGRFHRFPGEGKTNGNKAGWCKLFDDARGGIYGDFATGTVQSWQAEQSRPLTLAERETFRRNVEDAKVRAETKRKAEQVDAARIAANRWVKAGEADPSHAYLVRKGVKPHGIKQEGNALLIPMRDGADLHSLQTIAPDGAKLYQAGGRVAGCYLSIGKPGDTVCVAEGYATGATIHEATGYPVAVAFDCGNVPAVARTLRERLPAARIIVCADDDHRTAGNPGHTKAIEAARAVGAMVAVPEFGADRPDGATDFNDLAQHAGPEAVERAIANAVAPDISTAVPDAQNAVAIVPAGRAWPESLDRAAMHGIAGEFVRMVEPNTEADPAAILLQFLAAFGALVGRGPHYRIEGDQHHANLYVLLVGATAKGRKGTSWGRVREVFERIADDWKPHVSGLSTGEGLKYHVRDPRDEARTSKQGETVTEIVDAGVEDKRLFVVESEFASALRAVQRQGNTLSATIREGWDSGNLRTLTKHDPVTATGAHICIVGHITDNELIAELTATDTANGFANRFLFVAVKRSKLLPHGGDAADPSEVQAFADRIRDRAELARTRNRVEMTSAARAVWERVYPALSAGGDGLHGAVTARAEAQNIRLALLYCLLDGGDVIDTPHLLAALAVWQYCDATARYVFGASLGDRVADEQMRRLRQAGDAGMTRTEIRDAFNKHQSAERIGAALELLRGKCLVTCETRNAGTSGGRPTETWRVAK